MEMVDSLDEFESLRSVAGKKFPNFEMMDAKVNSALNENIQNPHFKKKVSLEEPKKRTVSTRKTDRLHDLRQLSSYWCS